MKTARVSSTRHGGLFHVDYVLRCEINIFSPAGTGLVSNKLRFGHLDKDGQTLSKDEFFLGFVFPEIIFPENKKDNDVHLGGTMRKKVQNLKLLHN